MNVLNGHPPPAKSHIISRFIPSAFKFIFSALLIGLAFSLTYDSEPTAFGGSDITRVFFLGAAATLVPTLGALIFLRSKSVINAILTLIVFTNVATAYIVHTDLYFSENKFPLVAVCIAVCFTLFISFRVMDDWPWSGAALSLAALFALGIVAGGYMPRAFWVTVDALPRYVACPVKNVFPGVNENNKCGITSVDTATIIQNLSFSETPNVYFVSFDSIIPKALLKKHFGFETTEFHDIFDEHFYGFTNLFANHVRSVNSISVLMALDEEVLSELRAEFGVSTLSLFSGSHPSPLLRILRENGYETTSIYSDEHFGRDNEGSYIDNYIVFNKDSTLCDLLDESIWLVAFWGYCALFNQESNQKSIIQDTGQLTIDNILSVSHREQPQFVISSIYLPGHTNKSFRYDNPADLRGFKAKYLMNTNRAAQYLEEMVEYLEQNDPDSILFVFGDHGAFISNGMRAEEDPEFFIQDRFGVLGGVYPRGKCDIYFDQAADKGYTTLLDAVHAILTCLSGGEKVLLREPDTYMPQGWEISERQHSYHYKEFLYE